MIAREASSQPPSDSLIRAIAAKKQPGAIDVDATV